MARLNIESNIFSSPLFQQLTDDVGALDKAIGMLVLFWFAAQKHWGRGELLPKKEFRKTWAPLIECGLAEVRDGGIYAKGSEEQFAWYVERIRASRKGGLATKAKWGPKVGQTGAETRPNEGSPSPSPSPNIKEEEYICASGDAPAPAKRAAPPDLLNLWNTGCAPLPTAKALSSKRAASWRARWTDKPDLAYWEGVIKAMASSNFCRGAGSTGWIADIDFLLKPDTHLRVTEGKYANRGSEPRPTLEA